MGSVKWGHGFVTVGGKRLEYRCWGPAPEDGRSLVLLHEGLGCVALWKEFPDALHRAVGLPVMAYSRAGYGWSDADDLPRPLDWMSREADVLPEVLAAFDITTPVLVGHSDGATIAAIAAGKPGAAIAAGQPSAAIAARQSDAAIAAGGPLLRRPGVLAVVLIAPHFFTEDMGLAEIARASAGFEASGLSQRMSKYHSDPDATFHGWANAWLSDGFRDWNVEPVLDEIRAPILVIQGQKDQYGTLAQVDAVTARVRGARTLILEACKHVPHLERPNAVLTGIVQMLQDNAIISR